MKNDGHQSVLAVSHAGAGLHFMSNWMDPMEELRKGFGNCVIIKYEFDTETEEFTFLYSYRPV